MSRLPSIDPATRTLILCGFPNVGKSSFINNVTRADVEVQPYAFTTKALYVGHLDYRFLRWQVIDTPGILDQPLEDRNTIEMQAVTALAHLKASVLFMMDVSEQCDRSIEEQLHLFESIRPLFANKPVLIGLNKVDIRHRSDLPPEKAALLDQLEKEGIPIIETSTLTQEGVMGLRDRACDELLAQRVEAKIQAKKITNVEDCVLNRVFVAYPAPRDEKVRAPFVPPGLAAKRAQKKLQEAQELMETDGDEFAAKIPQKPGKIGKEKIAKGGSQSTDLGDLRDENTRRLEREIELEMQDDYILDLKKHYMLKNPDEKYDIVPEIWEGHNLADFVDPEIQSKLENLLREEELLEQAGEYESDLDSDDEETKEKLKLALQIREKEKLLTLDHAVNKRIAGRIGSRIHGSRKRDRSMSRLENELGELGVDVDTKKMKNLQGQCAKPQLGKKMKVGRSRSLSAVRPAPRDELAFPDEEKRAHVDKLRTKAMRGLRREAKKGEADRHVYDLKPKHLFCGKRGNGKTDWR